MKIRDKERLEVPHVTVLRRTSAWRISLRDWAFLDPIPDPREVPSAIVQEIDASRELLCEQWNRLYPENPV